MTIWKTTQVELARYPRQASGSAQNLFRMVYWMARMNSLGRRPQVGRSATEVFEYAVTVVRQYRPGFVPVVVGT